jgi:hypothetical protein
MLRNSNLVFARNQHFFVLLTVIQLKSCRFKPILSQREEPNLYNPARSDQFYVTTSGSRHIKTIKLLIQ